MSYIVVFVVVVAVVAAVVGGGVVFLGACEHAAVDTVRPMVCECCLQCCPKPLNATASEMPRLPHLPIPRLTPD